MPDYDAGFKIVARTAGRQLSELAGVNCQQWKPLVDTLQTRERLADRAFQARQGRERFVVYMEAYTRWHASAPWSVLAKSALLAERERLPTLSLMYVLLPRGYRSQGGQFRLEVAGQPMQQVWFREICLWLQEPQPWWEDVPGLMALYPLCHHQRPRRKALAHAAQAIAAREADCSVRADLLTTLCVFGKLVYPDLNVVQLIGREQMKESKFYQEVLEEGRTVGIVEGRAAGQMETARTDICQVIEIRFGAEAVAEIQTDIQRVAAPEELSRLHRLAVQCRLLTEFRRALAAVRSSGNS